MAENTKQETKNMTPEERDEELRQVLKEQEEKRIQTEQQRIFKAVEDLLKAESQNIKDGKKPRAIPYQIWVNGVSNVATKQQAEAEIVSELVKAYRKRGYLVDQSINITGTWFFVAVAV